MKKVITLILIFFFTTNFFCQESLLKKYRILSTTNGIKLKKERKISYKQIEDSISSLKNSLKSKGVNLESLTASIIEMETALDSLKTTFKLGSEIKYSESVLLNGNESTIYKTSFVDQEFLNKQILKLSKDVQLNERMLGHVKLNNKKGRLYVNGVGNGKVYYYTLISGNDFRLRFREWTISALTIPIKYRFKNKNVGEDFSSSINLNLFAGRSFGRTNFMHRKSVDNKINNWKISYGLILGTSTVVLNKNNTSASNNPILNEESFNKGLFSLGGGVAYSFNAINFGLFYGYDYAIGAGANRWNYNKEPWLGLAIGYSIFKLQ
jgi:hypothetical protein